MLELHGYDGIHWYEVHCPLAQHSSRVRKFSCCSRQPISHQPSWRMHVHLELLPPRCHHVPVLSCGRTQADKVPLVEACSDSAPLVLAIDTWRSEQALFHAYACVCIQLATFASCRISVVSTAFFELKSGHISLLDAEHESKLGEYVSGSLDRAKDQDVIVERILGASAIVARRITRQWTVFLVHVTRSSGKSYSSSVRARVLLCTARWQLWSTRHDDWPRVRQYMKVVVKAVLIKA